MSVRAALRLPALRHGRPEVVAGMASLDRQIRWVHVGEHQKLPDMLHGGELILTVGLDLRAPAAQRSFVRRLAKNGGAGLVLELGNVFDQPPEAMVRAADAEGLPLIVLHREVHFVDVTAEIHEAIVSRELAIVRTGRSMQKELTSLLLDGAGAPELLVAMAERIANPVLLEKAGGGIRYHASFRTGSAEVLSAWETANGSSRFAVPVLASSDQAWGQLVALALDSPLDDYDREIVESAAPAVSIALMRRHEDELLSLRERGNLLAALADNRLHPRDAAARAGDLQLDDPDRLLLALALGPRHPDDEIDTPEWSAVWSAILAELRGCSIPVALGVRPEEREALALLSIRGEDRRAPTVERIAAASRDAAKRRLGSIDAVLIAAGRAVSSWEAVPDALREVSAALRFGGTTHGRHWLDATETDIDRWLWQMRGEPSLGRFVQDRLGPLLDHDRRRAAKLLPTLEALLDNSGHKAEAARALHLSRQSLYQRLSRIEDLLSCDLEDATTRLELHVAARALKHVLSEDESQAPRRRGTR
jgi:PucR family transcriptional regulator, purine catabolism regulatory protein